MPRSIRLCRTKAKPKSFCERASIKRAASGEKLLEPPKAFDYLKQDHLALYERVVSYIVGPRLVWLSIPALCAEQGLGYAYTFVHWFSVLVDSQPDRLTDRNADRQTDAKSEQACKHTGRHTYAQTVILTTSFRNSTQ